MKDLSVDRILGYLERMKKNRKEEYKTLGYMSSLLYAREVNGVLHMLWMCGCIDYVEFKKLEKKYSLTGKDLRKLIYCADLISDELEGKEVTFIDQ